MTWTTTPTPNASAATEMPVSLVMAASTQARVDVWYRLLSEDARFSVYATATSVKDAEAKLMTMKPEALLLDGVLYPSPQALAQVLTRYDGVAWVLLPAQCAEADAATVQAVPCVKHVFRGDFDLAAESGKLADAARALRASSASALPWQMSGGASAVPAGLRAIAVWNHAGGVGKTTLAINLALDARRRGLKTLLVGLGAPDDVGVLLPRLKATPNLTHWHAQPTADGLRQAVQSVDGLDVLLGYPDAASAAHAPDDPDAPGGLRKLVMTAALAGYAVIVLDVPSDGRAALALAAANQLLLVARPTLADALRAVEAFRDVTDRMAGEHRLTPVGIRVALNQMRGGLYTAQEFHDACAHLLDPNRQRAFPPIVATLPTDPRVSEAQNAREFPLLKANDFAKAFAPLADACLQVPAAPPLTESPKRQLFKLGPVKVTGL